MKIIYNKRTNGQTAGFLALFFGVLGVHRFYVGENGWGFAYLLTAIYISPLITIALGVFEGVRYLEMTRKQFDEIYNKEES